ncbi:MAG: DUF2339 domain-containing protein [Sphingomonas sp.]|nr:DUF2339 domain-containing protein [Sphingomonas sp.]
MSGLLFFAVVVLGVMLAAQGQRLRDLRRRLDRLERVGAFAPAATPPPADAPDEAPAAQRERADAWVATPTAPPESTAPPGPPAPEPEAAMARLNLESLVGARLPVWIGAIALVAAGFFLVRYSVESGLLGPGVRTALAAAFSVVLVAGSEVAHRATLTRSDPRIAQALAGAGIASAYGTLYIAAALYHFIAPLPAFVVMIAVTGAGLVLALRHGPPTAVLALAGGFLAPLVAGYDAAGIGPLLVYLTLFTGALFGLAIQRGWAWLAVAATLAGFGWVNFLLFVLAGSALAGAAAFVLVLAVGATLALPRAGVEAAWLRLAPLAGGLAQLLAFAPALDFSPLAWSFYLALAAATLVLAWRDARYIPGALAALGLALLLVGFGLFGEPHGTSLFATVAVAAIFAIPGALLLARSRAWAILALGGAAGPVLIADLLASPRLGDGQWAALLSAAATLAGWISWRRRDQSGTRDPGLILGAFLAATLVTVAAGHLVGWDRLAIPLALVALALGLWARRVGDPALFGLPAVALLAALVAGYGPLGAYAGLLIDSLIGEHLAFARLPALSDSLRDLFLPAAAATLLSVDPRQFGRQRATVLAVATAIGLMLLYHLAKLPLAIGDTTAFTRHGFFERAFITQGLLVGGWLAHRHPPLVRLATSLFILGLARIIWFDLLLLNPLWVAQDVDGIPLLNVAVIHLALAAGLAWTFASGQAWRATGMALALAAALAAVRQATHGAVLTGPISSGENAAYSVALLLLAIAWLGLGLRSGERDLRLAGLALLTAVTFKVFLIDAAALDGLLRVLSFLGLGIALIGLSWVYTRFLAARPKASVAPD